MCLSSVVQTFEDAQILGVCVIKTIGNLRRRCKPIGFIGFSNIGHVGRTINIDSKCY